MSQVMSCLIRSPKGSSDFLLVRFPTVEGRHHLVDVSSQTHAGHIDLDPEETVLALFYNGFRFVIVTLNQNRKIFLQSFDFLPAVRSKMRDVDT